jgi:hypothetical protein
MQYLPPEKSYAAISGAALKLCKANNVRGGEARVRSSDPFIFVPGNIWQSPVEFAEPKYFLFLTLRPAREISARALATALF